MALRTKADKSLICATHKSVDVLRILLERLDSAVFAQALLT